ncbi:MAG TPA: hypothetical protein VFW87_18825, partial [Pirellulales bacterium]|nr:hypothetical protein [Pirellulales bacterium]
GAWVLPTSAPQSGRYQVSARGSAGRGALAERMSGQYEKLLHRADAVIQCDADRADMVQIARRNETVSGDQMTTLDHCVWAIARQKDQTEAFLSGLTDYNRAIADYVLASQSAALSGEELSGKLAVKRSTLRDS